MLKQYQGRVYDGDGIVDGNEESDAQPRILEAVAEHQPVTVGELTKMFGLLKSTVQRTLITLRGAGWLRAGRGDRTRWEIGARVLRQPRIANRTGTSQVKSSGRRRRGRDQRDQRAG